MMYGTDDVPYVFALVVLAEGSLGDLHQQPATNGLLDSDSSYPDPSWRGGQIHTQNETTERGVIIPRSSVALAL